MTMVVIAAASVTIVDGLDAMMFSLAAPDVATSLRLDTRTLGWIFAVSMAGLLIGSFAIAAAADRVGRPRSILAALALFAAALLTMSVTADPGLFVFERFVACVGLGGAAPVVVALASGELPEERQRFLCSLIWAGIPFGGVVAAGLAALVLPTGGWRLLFILGAAAAIVPFALVLTTFRNEAEQAAGRERRLQIGALFSGTRLRATLLLSVTFFFGYVVTSALVSWLPLLMRKFGAASADAAMLFAALNVGGVVGALALGMVAQRASFRAALAIGLLVPAACLIAIPLLTGIATIGTLIVLAGSLAAGAQTAAVTLTLSRYEDDRRSTAVGWMGAMGRLGQTSFLAASGYLLSAYDGAPFFVVAAGAAIVALAAALFVTPMASRLSEETSAPIFSSRVLQKPDSGR